MKKTDVVIIGAGPAGLTAALYASRAGAQVTIVESGAPGGKLNLTAEIENYTGIKKIAGPQLAYDMYEHGLSFGASFEMAEVTGVTVEGDKKIVHLGDDAIEAKAVIIATGTKERKMNIPGEEEMTGRGVSYCAVCDGPFYRGKEVAVIGGGNTGIINAIALADMCEKVYLIQDKDKLTVEKILKDKLKQKVNVEVITNSVVSKIIGDDKLEKIIIKNGKKENEIVVDGMFISIGLMPQSDFLKGIIDLDKFNYAVSFDTKTKIDGIFVAGDIRTKPFRQITTAVNDGTTSALYALEYLDN